MKIWDDISDFFVDMFNGVIDWFLELLNSFVLGIGSLISEWLISAGLTIEIPSNVFYVLNDLTYGIGYILPLAALTPIVVFMLTFYSLKVVFSIYRIIANTIFKRVNIKM